MTILVLSYKSAKSLHLNTHVIHNLFIGMTEVAHKNEENLNIKAQHHTTEDMQPVIRFSLDFLCSLDQTPLLSLPFCKIHVAKTTGVKEKPKTT